MCIYSLKETINYYRELNTPVFICFIDIKGAFDRVSYYKVFSMLLARGAPRGLVELLHHWYTHQLLRVRWGGAVSQPFHMCNGIRQGSVLSPYLFNVYADQLNKMLNNSHIGCHIAGEPTNNFSYADDLALVSPSATALNDLLRICDNFANDHYIVYSTTKSVCMCIPAKRAPPLVPPSIYLGGSKLEYVESFPYLGHIITADFTDDEDIKKETRNICARGNTLIRKFKFCNDEVKRQLFTTYCTSIYCNSLWQNFKQATLQRLRVTYNNIIRRLTGQPPYCSASMMCVGMGFKSFPEVRRTAAYSIMQRVERSSNVLVRTIRCSDAYTRSHIRRQWTLLLYPNPH